jgi:membrane protein YdbS with pleckstrin-like domain
MAYRATAKPTHSAGRKRPPPALVLRRHWPSVLFGATAVCIVLALFFLPLALGATIDCTRREAGGLAHCTARDTIAPSGDIARFEGWPGELVLLRRHALGRFEDGKQYEDQTSALRVGDWTSRDVSERDGEAAVTEYARFALDPDPNALVFHRRVSGSRGHVTIVASAALFAVCFLLVGTFVERAVRLVVDEEVDELVVESVALLRRRREVVYPLSKIEQVLVEPLGPIADGTPYALVIATAGARHTLLQADASSAQRAVAAIRSAAHLG